MPCLVVTAITHLPSLMLTIITVLFLWLPSITLFSILSPCRYSTILCLDLLRAAEFLQVLNSRSSESCCTGDIKTCQDVEIDSDLLGSSQSLSILNISLTFCSRVPPNGFVYKTDLGDEAVMTVNTRSGNVFGSFKTQDGRSFGIERCHNKHVLKELGVPREKELEYEIILRVEAVHVKSP